MVEFNPDGSLKLPTSVLRKKEENEDKMRMQRCIKIERDMVNFTAPKKCILKLTLSDAVRDNRFVENLFNDFNSRAATPMKLKKINEKEFEIEVGTDFKRCSECQSLRNIYREFMYGNIIDKKGNCTYEGRITNFSYEDYFE
jgi:hypothetical protein